MQDVQLSPNYKLSQLTKSETAQRFNYTEQYTPPEVVIRKLKALCINLLDPLYVAVKKKWPTAMIRNTSGWRCERVNTKKGGAKTSQHLFGEAGDEELIIDGKEENLKLAQLVLTEKLDFDQMILEYGPRISEPEWIHLSWDLDKPKQRRQILRCEYNKEGEVVYYGVTEATILNMK